MLSESNITNELGKPAPSFSLMNAVDGNTVSLGDIQSEKATVVMFICNHCPYVKHVNDQLIAVANDYQEKGVAFVAISANDAAEYPEDSPENMKLYAKRLGYPFPYLYDESQEVAKAYGAVCTPDIFTYDSDLKLVYRGRLDASSPGNNEPTDGHDLRDILDDILAGKPVDPEQLPSMGCSIKWK